MWWVLYGLHDEIILSLLLVGTTNLPLIGASDWQSSVSEGQESSP